VDLFRLEPGDGPTSFSLIGELDIASVPDTEKALSQALQRERTLVLDTTDLRFIDSQGLRMLIRLGEQAQRQDTSVRILNCSTYVRRLLKIAVPQGIPGVQVTDVS
jgi:anti-anti-sigma factor